VHEPGQEEAGGVGIDPDDQDPHGRDEGNEGEEEGEPVCAVWDGKSLLLSLYLHGQRLQALLEWGWLDGASYYLVCKQGWDIIF
jgi:hypothetical protein